MTRKRVHDPRPDIRDAAAFDEPPSAGRCWIRDRLKAAGLREAAVTDITIVPTIAAIIGTVLPAPRVL